MSIRATRAPAGGPSAGGKHHEVRYATQPLWPGITTGFDARCLCTWAMHNGVYQVKVRDTACLGDHRAVAHG